jgi:hypothetical protein
MPDVSILNLEALGVGPSALQRGAAIATRRSSAVEDALSTKPAVLRKLDERAAANTHAAESIRPAVHCELVLQTDLGVPIAEERVLLQVGPDVFEETKTDAKGFARFSYFVLDDNKDFIPRLFLPDILEAESLDPDWTPSGATKDQKPVTGMRKRDATSHLVVPGIPKQTITVKRLTEEQKFQHFYRAYIENEAAYANGHPGDYCGHREEHWDFYHGAVCNQHVNFFLGYWLNFNHSFTRAGSTSVVCTLPMFSSAMHPFRKKPDAKVIPHRGFSEFVDPIDSYGDANIKGLAPGELLPAPAANNYLRAYEHAHYIRLSEYFAADGTPNPAGRQLIATLGNFNFYSVSNFYEAGKTTSKQNSALAQTRKWVKDHLADDPAYKCKSFTLNGVLYLDKPLDKTAAKTAPKHKIVDKLSDADLWDIIWYLKPSEQAELELLQQLRKLMNVDHHGGLLLKRGKNRASPEGVAPEDIELWTFSADGTYDNPEPIVLRPFAQTMRGAYRVLSHWAIWRLKPLRPGGYAPNLPNEGKVSVNNPPRFIHWHR